MAYERSAIGLGVLGVSVSLSTVTSKEADLHTLPSGSWLVRAQQSSSRTCRGEGKKESRGMSAPGSLPAASWYGVAWVPLLRLLLVTLVPQR